jgi:hypothetical protein
MPTPDTLKEYGVPGSRIPGSRFLRDYCANCDTPIRVVSIVHAGGGRKKNYCSQCEGMGAQEKRHVHPAPSPLPPLRQAIDPNNPNNPPPNSGLPPSARLLTP